MARVLPYADMDKMLSLSKRRGFIFQSSEIYGGLGSTYDYGPLGVELKRHVKEAWWRSVVLEREDVVGLDSAILMHPRIWEASGHVENFTDPLVECRNCHLRFRTDHVHLAGIRFEDEEDFSIVSVEAGRSTNESVLSKDEDIEKLFEKIRQEFEQSLPELIKKAESLSKRKGKRILDVMSLGSLVGFNPVESVPCPACNTEKSLTDPRYFNLMFKTYTGAIDVEEQLLEELNLVGHAEARSQMERIEALKQELSRSRIFLRPETAQGIFVNFKNVLDSTRRKLPFGIAQIGKAFRNEITPGNFTFRTREFEQMEVEFFVKPGADEEWLDRWVRERFNWYTSHGIRQENLRLRRHEADELAHYARDTYDIEYRFPWGWGELEGVADRTDFDLRRHAEFSGEDLSYFDDETRERYFPYVIEPSGGVDRATLAFWLDSYDEEPDGEATRTVLHLHRRLAPVTVAVLPLSRNDKLVPTARAVYDQVRRHFSAQYDDAQSIGRRYRRQDEIGTPYCVTVDFDSLEDHRVTIRDRDTMHQDRVAIADLAGVLQDKVEHGW